MLLFIINHCLADVIHAQLWVLWKAQHKADPSITAKIAVVKILICTLNLV